MNEPVLNSSPESKPARKFEWWVELVLVVILAVGALLRLTGIDWGEYTYLHPDERFLVWVGADIMPVGTPENQIGMPPTSALQPWRQAYADIMPDCQAWGGYFDTACSPLNPHNRGHTFYVYGTLPMFLTRYVVQWVYGHTGFAEMTDIGRPLSAMADLLTVFMVFLIGARIYNRKVGLLAAAFAAAMVLPIQQSHFFTMDTFANLFAFIAIYFAVRIMQVDVEQTADFGRSPLSEKAGSTVGAVPNALPENPGQTISDYSDAGENIESTGSLSTSPKPARSAFFRHPYFAYSLAFGLALGMAVASKLNVAAIAVLLPIAFLIRFPDVPRQQREDWLIRVFGYLVLGAVTSLLIFRIFQPYAFTGPGFFGLKPNPAWISNITELRNQSGGDVDFPPALQWARRIPVLFPFQNMVIWGMGLPLGLLAWAGFLWIAWRMLKGEWQRHILLWSWTALYFAWQAPAFNPTMRYFLPIYPTLAIFAAWAVFQVGGNWFSRKSSQPAPKKKYLALILGSLVLLATYAYAFGFMSIYQRPITRVEASRWIYQNIPGPINLKVQTDKGIQTQILPVPYSYEIQSLVPLYANFTAVYSGTLQEIQLGHVLDVKSDYSAPLQAVISSQPNGQDPLGNGTFDVQIPESGNDFTLDFDQPIIFSVPGIYYLTIRDPLNSRPFNLCGDILLYLQQGDTPIDFRIPATSYCNVQAGQVYSVPIEMANPSNLTTLYFSQLSGIESDTGPKTLTLTLNSPNQTVNITTTLTSNFEPGADGAGASYSVHFDQPVKMLAGNAYQLGITLTEGNSSLEITGSALANEGDWDDGLPLRMDGYDGFGGIYSAGLNFNMYTEENNEKRERFKTILDQAEYLVITSNRQWGSLPRLAERFPMSTAYYRALLGCPDDKTIYWCYSVAKPGMFQSQLGFDLVQIFQSDPKLGPLSVNDQFAEEAFTVYDHPKVLIFRKNNSYDSTKLHAFLDGIDLTQVIHITPKKAGSFPANLQLPIERLVQQREGGTWSRLFNVKALQNHFEAFGVILWYVCVWLLGLLVYPLLRWAMPGLPDRGYPLARIAGLLLLAWLVWMAGSANIPFTRLTISIVILLIAGLGGWLAYRQRLELRQEWQEKRKYFLLIEGLFLGFFVLFLLVRLGNPDLWHQWKGGEKPMDFAYFNAVLKSTTFPPYDPWFAGGYLNYYYYGFVFSGVLVKWLGIVPSFAYNLILPTMFALTAMAAFSICWNMIASMQNGKPALRPAFIAGLAGALLMTVLGNLGTLRMIFRGYQILVDPTLAQEGASLITRWSAAIQGIGKVLSGATLPYSIGDWYWNPTRLVPSGDFAIMEFPAFTFIYADPHAHMFALPMALFALAWVLSVLLGKARWSSLGATVASLFLGGLAVGALRPTNTWDLPTYLLIGAIVLAYTLGRYLDVEHAVSLLPGLNRFPIFIKKPSPEQSENTSSTALTSEHTLLGLPLASWRLVIIAAAIAGFAAFSIYLYKPFADWYGQGYNQVGWWTYQVTSLGVYFAHWGLFLFILVSWMGWETIEWMAATPVSALRKIRWEVVLALLAVMVIVIAMLAFKIPSLSDAQVEKVAPFGRGVVVALVAIPLAAWAGVLILRRDQPDVKRLILFLIGTAMTITLVVEIVVLKGDIGRQNTVFKLYLQAWLMLAISSGAAVKWLFDAQERWSLGKSTLWLVVLILLVGSAALFPLLGGTAKIKDRMAASAPHTLDGMAYMPYATYEESGVTMDLSQDYNAIRWMQENVQGSPVIVEANSRNLYRWYSRFSIYTGLPGVVGWEWHEQQQRALTPPDWVSKRLREIDEFYLTSNTELAVNFLKKYEVHYIVLGQLERATYPTPGLDKFQALDGQAWKAVFQDRDTIIYEVIK